MAKPYKQMCCCETCVVSKGLLTSLHSWQTKRMVFLSDNDLNDEATKYTEEILVGGKVGKSKIENYLAGKHPGVSN